LFGRTNIWRITDLTSRARDEVIEVDFDVIADYIDTESVECPRGRTTAPRAVQREH